MRHLAPFVLFALGALVINPATASADVVSDGACVTSTQEVLAACGDDPLLPDCGRAFNAACNDAGGTFTSNPTVEGDVHCSDTNPLLAACTLDWIVACVGGGGSVVIISDVPDNEVFVCRGV